jgi:hypothetical protein
MGIRDCPIKKLDLKKDKDIFINCKQLEDIILHFEIYDNGVAANLDSYLVSYRSGGNINLVITSEGVNKNSNNITIECKREVTNIAGDIPFELIFEDGNGKLVRSFDVILAIKPAVGGDSQSSNIIITALSTLEKLLGQTTTLISNLSNEISIGTPLSTSLSNANTIASSSINTINAAITTAQILKNELLDENSAINKHINNADIHVTKPEKDSWTLAATNIAELIQIVQNMQGLSSFTDETGNEFTDENNEVWVG